MYQEVRSSLTTTTQDGKLKRSEDEGYSSIRNIDDLRYEDNFPRGNRSEDEDLPPLLSRYSEVSVDDLESNCSSPPDLTSMPYASDELDIDVCIADAKKALAEIVSGNEVNLQEVKKAELDSYSLVECDKIDGKMFHSFVTMDDLKMFATGCATNRGGNPTNSLSGPIGISNQVSTSNAGLTCIKTNIERDTEKDRLLSKKKIRVFTIDEYDDFDEKTSKEKVTSSSESDLEVIVIEDHNVKPGEHTEKVTTMQDPGLMNIEDKISPDKQDAAFVIIPEETYYEDYEVPGLLKRNEFQSVVDCGNRFCIMGCVCSSLNLLKPRSHRCLHMECMFDHACTIKAKPIPSAATKNEDNSLEDLLSQSLSMKSEIELQKDIINELGVRLLQRESEIEKLKKQLIHQQIDTREKKNIKVMKTDELMMHGRRVQDGHYVDSFPFKTSTLDSLAKNTTVSIFIRLLMRKMYTPEYLSSMTMRNMKKEHVAAITEAAKERFSIYRGRNGNESILTEEKIKLVITSVFNLNHNSRKKSERTLAGLKPA